VIIGWEIVAQVVHGPSAQLGWGAIALDVFTVSWAMAVWQCRRHQPGLPGFIPLAVLGSVFLCLTVAMNPGPAFTPRAMYLWNGINVTSFVGTWGPAIIGATMYYILCFMDVRHKQDIATSSSALMLTRLLVFLSFVLLVAVVVCNQRRVMAVAIAVTVFYVCLEKLSSRSALMRVARPVGRSTPFVVVFFLILISSGGFYSIFPSDLQRVFLYSAAWEQGWLHPWLGFGPYGGHFMQHGIGDAVQRMTSSQTSVGHAHSTIFELWLSGGIPLLLMIASLWGSILWYIHSIKDDNRRIAWTSICVVLFIYSSLDPLMGFDSSRIMIGWLLGCLVAELEQNDEIKPVILQRGDWHASYLKIFSVIGLCATGWLAWMHVQVALVPSGPSGPDRNAVARVSSHIFRPDLFHQSVVTALIESTKAKDFRQLDQLLDLSYSRSGWFGSQVKVAADRAYTKLSPIHAAGIIIEDLRRYPFQDGRMQQLLELLKKDENVKKILYPALARRLNWLEHPNSLPPQAPQYVTTTEEAADAWLWVVLRAQENAGNLDILPCLYRLIEKWAYIPGVGQLTIMLAGMTHQLDAARIAPYATHLAFGLRERSNTLAVLNSVRDQSSAIGTMRIVQIVFPGLHLDENSTDAFEQEVLRLHHLALGDSPAMKALPDTKSSLP
jgi:hypothetical protein